MNIPNTNRLSLAMGLTFLLGSSIAQAEIYKWVDENGRTHYSEQKPYAAKTKPVDVKVAGQASASQQPTTPAPQAATAGWQEQERQLRQRQAEEAVEKASRPAPARPKSLSNGREDGTDASRCNLARDVLNGALRHSNGAPMDKNDMDIAKSDVSRFCH